MLNDEEKQALDKLKRSANYFVMPIYETKIILELIEKQQKEIEEMFAENQSLKYTNGNMIHKDVVKVNYTPNDKIKAKIEELDENGYWDFLEKRDEEKCKDILQSLLEKE